MKRILTILLCVILCFGATAISASAATNNSFYYDQLDENGRSAYNLMLNNMWLLYSGEYNPEAKGYYVLDAYPALKLDHPEIFWSDGFGETTSGVYLGPHGEWWEGERDVASDIAYLDSLATALASEAKSASDTTYGRVLYIHDWLTQNNTYNYTALEFDWPLAAFGALGALSPEFNPVCVGYAKAFKLVCDKLAIDCILVEGIHMGRSHAWNYVKMDDGKWYGVDVTLDDPGRSTALVSGNESRKYLLLGNTFYANHTEDTKWSYPKLSETDYNPNTAKPVEPEPIVGKFTDVPSTAWYADSVAWALDQGITVGTSKTTFSPESTCTRGQIITFLWRAAGSPAPAGTANVVDAGSTYYSDAIRWAAEKGMFDGDSFLPEGPCTRAAVVEFLWKYAGSPKTQVTSTFVDVAPDTEYAEAVAWALENGVTSGTSKTTFSPDSTCTRGQIVTFLYRAFGNG